MDARTRADIYALAACAGRGEAATTQQRDEMRALLRALTNPTAAPARDEGKKERRRPDVSS